MIVLIGGSSHVGKTLLAQKFLERFHYPYLSLDHLKMGMIRSGMTNLTVYDDVEMRYFLWPIVAEMIKTAIENKQNLIVEGCYIPETWKAFFSEEELKQIRCSFIMMSESYIRSNFDCICRHANAIEARVEDDLDLDRLIRCSAGFLEDCLTHQIPYYLIDNEFDLDAMANTIASDMGLSF